MRFVLVLMVLLSTGAAALAGPPTEIEKLLARCDQASRPPARRETVSLPVTRPDDSRVIERLNQIADRMEGRFNSFEDRISALERKSLEKKPEAKPAPESRAKAPANPREEAPESYGTAYRRAVRESKPFITWVGGEFCPT